MFNNWNILFWEYDFLSPHWLWLLLLVPFYLLKMWRNEKNKSADVKFSRNEDEQIKIESNWILDLRKLFIVLNAVVFILLIFALAKPFDWNSEENFNESYKNGIDIVIAMDVSLSMFARDFEPNRMEASKVVAKEFINGRKGDRIGLVVFAGAAYTACPTTLDYNVLKDQIDNVTGENLEQGTAIGTGLGTAVARLRNDSLPSKVIILLTDGSNCAGEITPEVSADLAKAKNIRVYTIGMGTNGEALSPIVTPFGVRFENMPVEIDEKTLTNIAQKTGGKYFRATDNESLQVIYNEIEKLEKHRILDKQFKSEPPASPNAFLNWAFLIIIVSCSFKSIIFRTYE